MGNWVASELALGLQKLLCLSLEGQPAAETIVGTVSAWCGTVTHRKSYDEDRDAPRFRQAFLTLAARCRRWPAPADFLEALPRLDITGPKLAHVASEETRNANIARIQALLGEKDDAVEVAQ